jgi:hypothetical protein
METLTLAIDLAFLGEIAKHAVEGSAVGILGAKSARDLAWTDFAAAITDERDELVAGGKAGLHGSLMSRGFGS